MSQTYGIESFKSRVVKEQQQKVRYVIVIETGGVAIARLFLATHQQVDEIDAGASEVAQMIYGITPTRVASGTEWDTALRGHSQAERAAAEVYTLVV